MLAPALPSSFLPQESQEHVHTLMESRIPREGAKRGRQRGQGQGQRQAHRKGQARKWLREDEDEDYTL